MPPEEIDKMAELNTDDLTEAVKNQSTVCKWHRNSTNNKLNSIENTVNKTYEQAKKTNGRVTKLENETEKLKIEWGARFDMLQEQHRHEREIEQAKHQAELKLAEAKRLEIVATQDNHKWQFFGTTLWKVALGICSIIAFIGIAMYTVFGTHPIDFFVAYLKDWVQGVSIEDRITNTGSKIIDDL